MSTLSPIAREIVAFNIAADSENRIHDDAVARRLGFHGGLVPGVAVYAYMAHMPVARWGRAWLERGTAECRFRKPVYDGAPVRLTAAEEGDALALAAESGGLLCATGEARMPGDLAVDPRPASGLGRMPPPPAERPPASEESLAVGRAIGTAPMIVDRAALAAYLDAVRESDPLYRAQGLVHPGQILHLANRALLENVVLGPWIHTSSRIRHHAVARVGERLSLHGTITANAEVKGHATVAFDAVVVADDAKVVAAISHAAIWRPRQLVEDGPAR
jgi:acyl dehydratase